MHGHAEAIRIVGQRPFAKLGVGIAGVAVQCTVLELLPRHIPAFPGGVALPPL
jgi:hypothetical protein